MTDKHMDEVMGELIEYCKRKDEDRDCARYMDTGECAECFFALTRKACRSYALKVVKGLMTTRKDREPGLLEETHKTLDYFNEYLQAEIDRLKEQLNG